MQAIESIGSFTRYREMPWKALGLLYPAYENGTSLARISFWRWREIYVIDSIRNFIEDDKIFWNAANVFYFIYNIENISFWHRRLLEIRMIFIERNNRKFVIYYEYARKWDIFFGYGVFLGKAY